MIKTLQFIFCLLGISLFAQNQAEPTFASSQVIVKFKSSLQSESNYLESFEQGQLKIVADQIDVSEYQLIGNKKTQNTYLVHYDANITVESVMELYKQTDLFEYVEPNFVASGHGIPNDPLFSSRQWSMVNDGTFPLSPASVNADIDMDLAWDITTGDPNLVVAILDSGMKMDHPEISNRIWVNTNESLDGVDNDSNNYIDDTFGGWDFAYNDNNPTDDHGHGTNVGGIAVATGDNGIGYAGVNWQSQIMVVKILDNNNSGFYSWMADGIYYAVDNGADVMNMSVGGNSPSNFLLDAVNYAYANNVALVVSTGNGDTALQYPSRYANSIAVGSTDPDDSRTDPFFWSSSSGSNFGPEIDLVAPGNYIYGLSYNSNTNYNSYWGGTSQAAPHVAGVISLLLSVNPNLTVDQINAILIQSSEDQVGDPSEDTPGFDDYHGYGRLNAHQALTSDLLSINDFENDKSIRIFPNPVGLDQELSISNLNSGDYVLRIYNITGQRISEMKFSAPENRTRIDLPVSSRGIYILDIEDTQTGSTFIKKLVIE